MGPDATYAQLEYLKMQLMGSLNQIAGNMRECAAIADSFAQVVGSLPYNGNPPVFPPLNGQFQMPVGPPVSAPAEVSGRKRKSRSEDPDGKRKKKLKDPNAPKRPASSYLLFQNDVRNELKAQNPEMRNADLLSQISKLWAEMPPEEKDVYESRNKLAKEEWMKKKTVYEAQRRGEASGVQEAISPTTITPTTHIVPKLPPPTSVAAVTTPSEESSVVDEESSEEGSSEEDEVDDVPPPKKSKKDATVLPLHKDAAQGKEKKHKKSKV